MAADSKDTDIAKSALDAFEVESAELLEDLERNLLVLEIAPGNTEVINSTFRAIHTIKGSSGLAGLERVSDFAHVMETLLVRLRDGEAEATGEIIELLLEARDHVANLIRLTINSISPDSYVDSVERQLINGIRSHLSGGAAGPVRDAPTTVSEQIVISADSVDNPDWHISLRFGPDTFKNGMDPMSFIRFLGGLGDVTCITTITDSIPPLGRMAHDVCYLGFEIDLHTSADSAEIDEVFEFVRDDCSIAILPPRAPVQRYASLMEALPESSEKIGEIFVRNKTLTPFELLRVLRPADEFCDDEAGFTRGRKQPGVMDKRMSDASKTIRVETGKLDALMNIVGEMVIAQANVMQNSNRIHDRQLGSSTAVVTRLIQDLREKVNEVRMVPVEGIFSRHYRTVRDICNLSGKQIELEISGGETEIDRNIIEMLSDPLLHIVRNAADHGIEDPETRRRNGKPPGGRITIRASQEAGSIHIEVSDDGRGIDHRRVYEKAVSMGIVTGSENMSREEMLDLIFHAGLSTKEQASSVSGRGVGMDVVKQNIERIRGSIGIKSEPGMGTSITVSLPLTLAIIEGFMVRSGRQKYAIPLDIISECIELTEKTGKTSGRRRLLNLRGRLIPFVRLREFFGVDQGKGHDGGSEFIVVVVHNNKEIGLAVDELFGEEQIVIKSLGKVYEKVRCLSGATIMGDGSVALILDVPRIFDEAYEDEAERSNDEPEGGEEE